MTETIRAITLKTDIRKGLHERNRIPSGLGHGRGSTDATLDRLPIDPLGGDAEAHAAQEAPEHGSEPSRPASLHATRKGNAALIASIASAAAGLIAGVWTNAYSSRAKGVASKKQNERLDDGS